MLAITNVSTRAVRAPRQGLDHATAVTVRVDGLTPATHWFVSVDQRRLHFARVDAMRGTIEGLLESKAGETYVPRHVEVGVVGGGSVVWTAKT
jgi:hypothetical protein